MMAMDDNARTNGQIEILRAAHHPSLPEPAELSDGDLAGLAISVVADDFAQEDLRRQLIYEMACRLHPSFR